jgi:glyoxylase-like metal-dependent hydrolase (beta-lactamase superfamily II)
VVARSTPEQQIVNDAAEALGGADRVRAVQTLVLRGAGTQYNLGQDVAPGASGQTFAVTDYTRAIDVARGRARTELTRQPDFAFFQGPAPQRQVTGIDGDVAYNVAPNGTATRAPGAATNDRRVELLHHPITAVQAALAEGAALANARTEDGQSLVDISTGGQTITLVIDATTKLPSVVSHRADNVNLGDVVISTSFADYEDVNGLQLPARLTSRIDDFTMAEYRLSDQAVDGDAGELVAPEAARNAAAPTGPPPVTAEVIAPGVWLMGGGSHHSVLVEFNDHLMLIEAPQNEQRTLAAIAKARETVPGKPLTQLVNSHHHFDHSGGVRAAVAEGLTLITHEGNRAFYEEMARRPHTINPDALAKNPKALTIETASDQMVLTDGDMTVNLYSVTGAHCETMLIAHFPHERILVEGDVYTPGAAAHIFAGKFLEDVRARNLSVDRIVPLHGTPVPFAQLVDDAATASPTTN